MRAGDQGATDEDEDIGKGELAFLPERTCAICYQDQNPAGSRSEQDVLSGSNAGIVGSAATDITNPYAAMPCGCIYCFVCLAQRIEAEEGEGWTCLRCGEVVQECKPWDGDVLEPVAERKSERTGSEDAVTVGSEEGYGRPNSRRSVAWADELIEEEKEMQRTMSHVDPMPIPDDEDEGFAED
ncbi:hypothetical protein KC343_g21985 [Hortaea werneckii]|nr:hypothetical protein KC352_g42115 [Hortaea werneckii]KAI7521473.1 hypothetical protein KC317_g22090 [Hortaea werneckii]KAI7562386.1 hypothetical protein KC346_g22052 [Hortaea werneckii]KAI7576941.1 hypothetical protein KC343_g21985 [Hortaea werneckii]KAI7605084.1 hypothetical protein KC319_g21781 [Hortaea werneckii]